MDDLPEQQIVPPREAARLLADMLTELANGNAVSLMALQAELTTQQVADLLGVSRPYLVTILYDGKIPTGESATGVVSRWPTCCATRTSRMRRDPSGRRSPDRGSRSTRALRRLIARVHRRLRRQRPLPGAGPRSSDPRSAAQVIVTSNTRDFPANALEPFGIEAQDPDVCILGLIDLDPGSVVTVVHQQQKDLVRSPTTLPALLDLLERQGLAQAVAVLRGLLLVD